MTGAFVYLASSRRGGTSPKISPSCGRAWQVKHGASALPTL
jgi:hypothetical protein